MSAAAALAACIYGCKRAQEASLREISSANNPDEQVGDELQVAHAAIAAHIRTLSVDILHAQNNRDFAWIRGKLAPNFQTSFDSQKDVGYAERMDDHCAVIAKHPEYRIVPTEDPVIDLQDLATTGIVRSFETWEIHGAPPGVIIPGTGVLEFQEFDGEWLVVRATGMRTGGL